MFKQDIRNLFTKKVSELIAQGYTLHPDSMGGHQGEIAKVDLCKDGQVIRVLLDRGHMYHFLEHGYEGDTVELIVGIAANVRSGIGCWETLIWNNELQIISREVWAAISNEGEGWYTTIEEGKTISDKRLDRYRMRGERSTTKLLSDAYKPAMLRWARKQPRMKSCRLDEISSMEKVATTYMGTYYKFTARGRNFVIRRNK